MDYNTTVQLPKTDFPMRAGLPKREPETLAEWEKNDIYAQICEANKDKPLFILHDGPPFSNGDMHCGHVLNRSLKDFIVRYRNMDGHFAPFTPGWDNHGLPIESAIIKKKKLKPGDMSVAEFRSECHGFAAGFVDKHRAAFKRLGALGDWENPYLTMSPRFESDEVRVFGEMYQKGLIYKGLKPVYWCCHDKTALAEAEIEYMDQTVETVYVKFAVSDCKGLFKGLGDVYFVIWTTTTWTLPGNVAIAVHPEFVYDLIKVGGETYVVARELKENFVNTVDISGYEDVGSFKGHELEHIKCRHPFLDRESLVITGLHVTAETGTGQVHTAPGHGAEDYTACLKYNLPLLVPVDDNGFMTDEAGAVCAGMRYDKANIAIRDELIRSGALLKSETVTHPYPHCWRCGSPILFRATPQWFANVDSIKDAACAEVERINWYPAWGRERMLSMIRERSDWCISRQRSWGLPIPVFYCGDCGKPVCTPETIDAVANAFAERGSDVWWDKGAEILPENFACPHCGSKENFSRETDTLDGWFDSGSSHAACLHGQFPHLDRGHADLYLEGVDQYRGWFQSSLLTSVATRGRAPYDAVVTHGWVVDGQGKQMHKSKGNGVDPLEIANKYGADILRLWVASGNYQDDMRVSDEILKQLSELYLKIRNTARFMLGNLNGFDPAARADLLPLDAYAVSRMNRVTKTVREAYDAYRFHIVTGTVHNFCVTELSNFYFDIIKDRLYCDGENSRSRRSAQRAIHKILTDLTRLIAPILAFTAEEIWKHAGHSESVFLAGLPEYDPALDVDETYWQNVIALRESVNAELEIARAEKIIGKSLEAEVTVPDAFGTELDLLADMLIVSKVTVSGKISVKKCENPKCPRCWKHHGGENELCARCGDVVKA